MSAIEQFRGAIANAGLTPPDHIEGDGELHRFASNGKRGDDSAWYVLHPDGIAAGAFGDWRGGISQSWRADIGRPLSPVEARAHSERIAAAKRKRDEIGAKERADAAANAVAVMKAALPARDDHPYLVRKGVVPVATLRELPVTELARLIGYSPKQRGEPLVGRILIAPVRVGDTLSSLEFIDEHGNKSALSGGAKAGGFWSAQKMPEGDGDGLKLLLAEGIATALSLQLACGHPSFAALSCGMLTKAAIALHERFPKASIVVCGDLGSGERHAREAALAVGGFVAFPHFDADRPDGATDFNDLAQHSGAEAVERAIANAHPPGAATHQPAAPNAAAGDLSGHETAALEPVDGELVLLLASEVKTHPIRWLWPDRVAVGKVTLIAGDPGLGKSLVTLAFSAHVTKGKCWPVDGAPCEVGDVIIMSAEDDPADTLVPRLLAAGADCTRIQIVKAVRHIDNATGRGEDRMFSLRRDLDAVRLAALRMPACRLIVIDPLSAYLDGTDSHNNSDVRAVMAPLATLASDVGAAVVCVTHLNKGSGSSALYRTTGSLAFVAAARAAFAVTKDKDNPARRLILPMKNNLAPDVSGVAYSVAAPHGVPVVVWEPDPVTITADEALAPEKRDADEHERPERSDAVRWLRCLLEGGPCTAKDAQAEARAAGISPRTLRRAKSELDIDTYREGGVGTLGKWMWRLVPAHKDGQPSLSKEASGPLSQDPRGMGVSAKVASGQDSRGNIGHVRRGTVDDDPGEVF